MKMIEKLTPKLNYRLCSEEGNAYVLLLLNVKNVFGSHPISVQISTVDFCVFLSKKKLPFLFIAKDSQ